MLRRGLAFVLGERRIRGGRFISVCLATLSTALLLEQALTLLSGTANIPAATAAVAAGTFASYFAAQL